MIENDGNAEAPGGGSLWRWLGLIGASLALIFALGICAGYAASSAKHGFSLIDGVILAGMVAATGGIAMLIVRLGHPLLGRGAHVPTRERQAFRLLLISFCLGLIFAFILVIAAPSESGDAPGYILSNRPIDPIVALVLSAVILFILPIGSWKWHSIVDEHERDAYRVGAVTAAYLYLFGAPVWWLLWRGGLVPPPDGIIIYYAFCIAFGAVWLWKKYR